MTNLKLAGKVEENITIEKNNKVLITNYDKYIEFYKYFYEMSNIFIENKEILKKDCVFIDITTIAGIIKELEFKKNTLLYDFILIKYNEIDINKKDEFYSAFLKQIEYLKSNMNLEFELIPEEIIDKVIIQNINTKINYSRLIKDFENILHFVVSYNINKTYIIIYNSSFFQMSRNLDNCYTFDVNSYLNIKDYNILISDEIRNINYELLIEYLKEIWPVDYFKQEIENLLEEYFSYGIHKKIFKTKKEKMYLLSSIINKEYKFHQEITCDKVVFDSIIKSFIDNL